MDQNTGDKQKKPVVRKCHNCGKVLDEDKDFCLHCGETYQDIKRKRNINKRKLILWIVILAVVALIATAIIVGVKLYKDYQNQSRYWRVVEYIKDVGKEERIETTDESGETATVKKYTVKLSDQIYIYCTEKDENRFYLCTSIVTVGDIEGDETEFKLDVEICIDEETKNKTNLYEWKATVSNNAITGNQDYDFVRTYTGTLDPAIFDVNAGDVVARKLADKNFVNTFVNAKSLYEGLEGADLEFELKEIIIDMHNAMTELEDNSPVAELLETAIGELEDIVRNDEMSDAYKARNADESIDRFNAAYFRLYPSKAPTAEETPESVSASATEAVIRLMSSVTRSSDDEDEPIVPPESSSQKLLKFAVQMISWEARTMMMTLSDHLIDNNVQTTIGELGFTTYQTYLDSLSPLKTD